MKSLPQTVISSHIKSIKTDGFTVQPSYLQSPEISSLLNHLEEDYSLIKGTKYKGLPSRDTNDKIVYNLPLKHKIYLDPVFSETVQSILRPILNDKYYRYEDDSISNYYLTYYNARSSGDELPLHIDSHIPSSDTYCWMVQVIIALQDMSISNGCTKVVRGSHLSGTYTDRQSTDFEYLQLKAGDLAIWDSRLWHGTTANVTSTSRWALIATFASWWIKPTMDFTRSLPQHIYNQLSSQEKSLLGFCSVPPHDEFSGINTKKPLNSLLPRVSDYLNT